MINWLAKKNVSRFECISHTQACTFPRWCTNPRGVSLVLYRPFFSSSESSLHRDEIGSCSIFFCYRRYYENRTRNPRKYHAYVQSLIDITYAHQTCGYFFPWRTTAKILAAIPIVSAVAILLFPETPYWLIENGRVEEAR